MLLFPRETGGDAIYGRLHCARFRFPTICMICLAGILPQQGLDVRRGHTRAVCMQLADAPVSALGDRPGALLGCVDDRRRLALAVFDGAQRFLLGAQHRVHRLFARRTLGVIFVLHHHHVR